MTPEEAAEHLYEKWLILAISGKDKQAIRTLCAALNLPDPAIDKRRVISSGPRRVVSTHPWGEDEPRSIGQNVR